MSEKNRLFDIKKHLLTGVSYMIPVVVAAGFCMAVAKIFGGALVANYPNTIAGMINTIGVSAMTFAVPVLTAFIAYSIADRPGIVPGLIIGFLANLVKAGFLGGIVGGLIVGYLIILIEKKLKVPNSLKGMMPILIIPFLATLIGGLVMIGLVGIPIAAAQNVILAWMTSLKNGSRFILGAVIGGMMGFDMGGPINKTASFFGNALLAQGIYEPTASKLVGGMIPPIGVALSVLVARHKYTKAEQETAKAGFFLGLCYITEGVLPFAASDPFRVIPACSIGAAIGGGLSYMWGITSTIPHGGMFVVPLMNKPLYFLLALIIGSAVTATILTALKPNIPIELKEEKEVDYDFNISIGK